MAASEPTEVFSWLKTLPLAPEYHPTVAEFQDPISYIFKIEKEASKYGICKIIPPVPPPPKKSALANLNRSLAARNNGGGSGSGSEARVSAPTFTTRQQQIGFCPRRPRPAQRPVWQSGERYTVQEFEAKAKSFERGFLRKCAKKGGGFSPLEIESMYWKATIDKPFSVEYANDMPGSAFVPVGSGGGVGGKRNGVGGGRGEAGEGVNLGETAWNMRAVSRAKGSLLRFMKEEIPGVTSPMVYLAMLFSWFAWHVEDHDLHSLNYLHMGASKTWYGVPREAAVAFEEVVRVYGYNGEINPLVTFSVLGEKTTVMSPEVLVRAGVPCCRLVQNAGEFVVTFPRAYHTGFSHGFNCAEAANIATPEWLMVAKDAAIRRASINYPPMVSHFQLLYDLALELHSRIPVSISAEPRSSRLKDKKKGEGETVVKELFVQSVLENNDLLHALGKGSPIVLLPKSSADMSLCSKFRVGSQSRFTHSFPLASCNSGESISSRSLISDDLMVDEKQEDDKVKGFYSMKGKLASLCEGSWVPSFRGNKVTSALTSKTSNMSVEGENVMDKDGLSDHRLFSCVTCGILSFACVAIIKPREAAARYLMSADCSFFNDWVVNAGVASNVFSISNGDPTDSKQNTSGGWRDNGAPFGVHDTPVRSTNYQVQMEEQNNGIVSNTETNKSSSALGLLALNYGNSSDSEEDLVQEDHTVDDQEINCTNCSSERKYQCGSSSPSLQNCRGDAAGIDGCSLPEINSGHEPAFQNADFSMGHGRSRDIVKNNHQNFDCSDDLVTINSASAKLNGLVGKSSDSMKVSHTCSPDTMKVSHTCSPDTYDAEATKFCKSITPTKNENVPFVPSCDDDSSRMHVFCLEHAVEVEQQLRGIGGVHIQLLCHPDYPKIEAEAKAMAEELGINNLWSDVTFRDATKDDEEMIQSALDSEDALPKNGDWAVKLGINLFYSANLSRSPLYSKQMPYNSVIYNAFGRISPASSSARSDGFGRRSSRQKKVVAGKWCGKVWMSNQVHPFLAKRDPEDEEDEEEEERSFHARALPDERPERKNCKSTITKKYARKRKLAVEDESTKKVKHVKKEDEVSDDSMDDDAREQRRRSLRSKHAMSLEAQSTQKARNAEAEDAASDDSMDVRTHKQQKSILRNKKTSYVETDDMVSDDSLGGGFHRLHKQILRSKQAKHARREDVVSDDSLDNNSHRVRVRIPKSNQTKRTEQKDPAADDSLDVDSHQLLRNISKSQLAKFMEKEDSASEDFRGDNLRKSYRKTYKSKQAKSIEREDEVLDEPVEDDARQVSKRALRSKQTKSAMQQKIKQEPRQVKQAASRSVKRGTHQLVKQETQRLKQQTSRIRNNQCEPNDSDSSAEEEPDGGPSSRLRKRAAKPQKTNGARRKEQQQTGKKKGKSASVVKAQAGRTEATLKDEEAEFVCDIEGCTMGFATKQELALHKKNICPVKGCGKKFFSHKYLVQHRRVHMDDRPLRCPWKGCKMTFKWAWARTEHIRVHTGARPYICAEPGCGQTFRFVSDFSRHKRKTGHSVKKGR